jgi:4-amino-4-deoxy-L-arabinose transferase-like glycosyltransferase
MWGAGTMVGSDDSRTSLFLFVILAAGLGLRVAAAVLLPEQNFPDAVLYREQARQLWQHFTFDDPYRMPLYQILVALTGPGWGSLALDVLLSTAAIWLAFQLSLALFDDAMTALVTAFAMAVYPYFIFYAVVGLTETLFITLLLAAYVCWYRGWFSAAAVCAVLSTLTRPTFDLLAPALVVYFSLVIHRLSYGATAKRVAGYAAIYILLMSSWWIHNYHAYGTFVRLHFGANLTLYGSNNPHNQSGGVSDVNQDFSQFEKIPDIIDRDRAYRDAAVKYITEDPIRFIKLAGLKFMRFWRLWPFAEDYRTPVYVVGSVVSFVPVLILAIVYLVFFSSGHLVRIFPLLLFIGYLTAVHMIMVGSMRYRLPLEPFLIVLAAAAITRLVKPIDRIR